MRNLLKVISTLQNNSLNMNGNIFLTTSKKYYNTRVVSFYRYDGTIFTANYDNDLSSSTFRVMDVNHDCCNLLILNKINDLYYSTEKFITIQLDFIGAVFCIQDVNISNL